MANTGYPYTTVPNRLREVLAKIPTIGKPSQAKQDWLKGLGYTSGNDMSILATMRRLGIIGDSGAPTEFWDAIRSKDGPAVAQHVRAFYSDLFDVYPDAHQQDDEAVLNFFRSTTSKGQDAQRLMLRTFKVLGELGDFGSSSAAEPIAAGESAPASPSATRRVVERTSGGLTLNVNIQLQLPESSDGDVYDKFFEAMGKHLKGLASIE